MTTPSRRIVICGAGIAGIAAAYQLVVVHGCDDVVLVEAENPLSMTSDKSTEGYRNWWPGPDPAMTAYMNRSIDMLEAIAHATGNRINLNRRGYAFASADPSQIQWLIEMATKAAQHGAGPVRVHDNPSSPYQPAQETGFASSLTGADIIVDRDLIRRFYPYLAADTCVVAHVRRAGWLSAQQLGQYMLETARSRGLRLLKGRVASVETHAGRLQKVRVAEAGGQSVIDATDLVLCAGPMLKPLADNMGVDLPIYAERHRKISFADTAGTLPRNAPMIIWLDAQQLPWSPEERETLASDESTKWLTEPFPGGVHGRPDGGAGGSTVLALYNYESVAADVVFPLPEEPTYAEITLRGMSTMVPAMQTYVDKGVRPYIDGGYYIKTKENRPLIGPTSIEGVFISGAYSGFGIMASCAGSELLAKHLLGLDLPAYAPAFMLSRYQDPDYLAMLDKWGDGGQL